MASRDATLAAIAAKAEKETAYHLRHAGEWVIRLGDGTEEVAPAHAGGAGRALALSPARCSRRMRRSSQPAWHPTPPRCARAGRRWSRACWPRRRCRCRRRAAGCSRGGRRGRAHRASRPPAGGDAAPAAHLSGCDVVMEAAPDARLLRAARAGRSPRAVVRPEIPVLTIADLGVLRDARLTDGWAASRWTSRRPIPAAPP